MSTAIIIVVVVVVVALVLTGLWFLLPRARVMRRERELSRRREHKVGEHREEAEVRGRRAETAAKRSQVAAAEAERERAEAQVHESKAKLHERELADHELVAEDEREHFAGTSAAEAPEHAERSAGGERRREPAQSEHRTQRKDRD